MKHIDSLIRIASIITFFGAAPAFSQAHESKVTRGRKVCKTCFEYYDGWYSYIVIQNNVVLYSSALYGKEEECQRARALDKVCKSSDQQPAYNFEE